MSLVLTKTFLSNFNTDSDTPINSAISRHVDDHSKKEVAKAGSYWEIYFYIQYILGICPFYFSKTSHDTRRKDPSAPIFITKSWQPQKYCCYFIGFIAIIGIIGDLRQSLPKDTTNATEYFTMTQTISFSVGKIMMLKLYWMDKERILNLLNLISSTDLGSMTIMNWKRKIVTSRSVFIALCFLYLVNEVVSFIIQLKESGDAGSCGKLRHSVWQTVINDAKFKFLFQKVENVTCPAPGEMSGEGGSPGEVVLEFLAVVNYYQVIVLGAFDNLFVLGAVLTLWTMVTSFFQNVEENMNMTGDIIPVPNPEKILVKSKATFLDGNKTIVDQWWAEFYGRFRTLRRTTDDINILFGTNVNMIMIETIVFFAVAFESLFYQFSAGKPDFMKTGNTLMIMTIIIATFMLCADMDFKMLKVRKWVNLSESRSKFHIDQVEYILDDLEYSGVSIKASNIYPINYYMLANIAGTSVTYFIICVQI